MSRNEPIIVKVRAFSCDNNMVRCDVGYAKFSFIASQGVQTTKLKNLIGENIGLDFVMYTYCDLFPQRVTDK